jgi:outer membrane protein OmpA-like peptidoglycan-associated protein
MKAAGLMLVGAAFLCAQAPPSAPAGANQQTPGAIQTTNTGNVPIFRVEVTSRSIAAVNYHNRQGTTHIAFQGTALMPAARGQADVTANTGATRINLHFDHLSNPSQFGREYLTYVLWAITPEGRPERLGEVTLRNPKDTSAGLYVTTDLQTFGMIVTAEPYFAVQQPSDVVVMENIIRKDTSGTLETVDAKYELLKRGEYTLNIGESNLAGMTADLRIPLELREAREAIAIAKAQGADKYAADTMRKVATDMQNAEGFYTSHHNEKEMITDAREATEMAEDARRIAITKEEQIAKETMLRNEQEAKQRAAEEAQRAAEEAQRRAQAEADAQKAQEQRKQAEIAMAQAREAQQQAEAARQAALAEEAKLAQEKTEALNAKQQAEKDAQALRERLKEQLNMILATRDTARGLIVNMSDVLFDFNQATLKPGAREKLAKVSGILLAYPTLHISVEGHTDSIGTPEYNMKLSQRRADSVRDYLVSNGINPANVQAIGKGEDDPVASNATAAGRQQNRRVELVVTGDVIGQPLTEPNTNTTQTPQAPANPGEPTPYQPPNAPPNAPAGNQAPPQQ